MFCLAALFVGPLTSLVTTAQNNATLSPAALNFAGELIGTTSAAKRISLFNKGTSAISVANVEVSGDFAITLNDCQNGVKVGTHCDVFVAYSPTATGSPSGTITFTDTASNSPQAAPLHGTPSAINLAPSAMDFGRVIVGDSSPPQFLTVSNLGLSPVSITSISGSGVFAAQNPCGSALNGGTSC